MALRQRGKDNFYHAYFRTVIALPDGRLKYATTTVNLGTDDLVTARALEAELMRKNKAARLHQRATARLTALEVAAGERPVSEAPAPILHVKRQRRLKIGDALETAKKYRELGETTVKRFRAFSFAVPYRYMDEVTPEIAFDYLAKKCPDPVNGKNFNNIKSALNIVFRLTLLDSGMDESPFARIPNRKNSSNHQRPFTEKEFIRIYTNAPEPWKSAALIAWFTGLRQKDVFSLRWDCIADDVLTVLPAKTARFGRAVRIPIHPQLAAALKQLPHVDERVLGAWEYNPASITFRRAFGALLRRLKIGDTADGFVAFNSLRDSFVTRCDAAGIPRHAVRGLVGHVSDDQTDLYSHDLTTARLVQQLPAVNLDKSTGNDNL